MQNISLTLHPAGQLALQVPPVIDVAKCLEYNELIVDSIMFILSIIFINQTNQRLFYGVILPVISRPK
jgi:hypothetical protein